MIRPIESDYTSHVAYTRALESYCERLEQTKPSLILLQKALDVLTCSYTNDDEMNAWHKECMQVIADIRKALKVDKPADYSLQSGLDALINLQPILANGIFTDDQLKFIDPHIEIAMQSFENAVVQRQPLTDEQVLDVMGQRIGYGRIQQIAGQLWDARHGCAPRGSMGVTVKDSTQPQRQRLTEPEYMEALGYLRDQMTCSAGTLRRVVRAIEDAIGAKP